MWFYRYQEVRMGILLLIVALVVFLLLATESEEWAIAVLLLVGAIAGVMWVLHVIFAYVLR